MAEQSPAIDMGTSIPKQIPSTSPAINDTFFKSKPSPISATQITPDLKYEKAYGDKGSLPYLTPDMAAATVEGYATHKQNWFGEMGWNVAKKTIGGEIVGGTIESIGSLSKIFDRMDNVQGAFEQNMIEKLGSDIRKVVDDNSQIYTSNAGKEALSFGDKTYWANMVPSVASSISIMAASAGIGELAKLGLTSVKALTAAAELSKVGEGISLGLGEAGAAAKTVGQTLRGVTAEAVQATKPMSEIARLAKVGLAEKKSLSQALWEATKKVHLDSSISDGISSKITNIFIPATISRSVDSSREAVGRYKQYYDEYKDLFKNDFKDDADGGVARREAKAKDIAGQAAANGFRESYGNIGFDILEWTILGGLGKGATTATDALESNLFRSAVRAKLGEQAAANMGVEAVESGVKGTVKSIGHTLLTHGLPEALKTSFIEGFDETFMDFFMNDGKRQADVENKLQKDDGSNFLDRLIQHHTIAKNWDSFVGGALGGVAMTGVMSNYKTIKNKYDTHRNEYITNLANEVSQRNAETHELFKEYNRARQNNDPAASNLKARIVANAVGNSYSNGTTDLDIEGFKNMSKLNDTEKSQLEFMKDKDGNLIPNTEVYSGEIYDALVKAKNIFNTEFSKNYHSDAGINYAIQHKVASTKAYIATLQGDIDTIKAKSANTNNSQLDSLASSELADINTKHSVNTASMLYDTINKHNTTITELEATISHFDGSIGAMKDFINTYDSKLEELKDAETKAKGSFNIRAAKEARTNHEDGLAQVIGQQDYLQKELIKTQAKLADTKVEQVKELTQFKTDNTISPELDTEVNSLVEKYAKSKKDINVNQSMIAQLEGTLQVSKAFSDSFATEESIAKFAKKYNSDKVARKSKALAEYTTELHATTTEQEAQDVYDKFPDKNTETNKDLHKLLKDHINDLKSRVTTAANVSANPAAPSTTPTQSTTPELDSLNERKQDTLRTIRKESILSGKIKGRGFTFVKDGVEVKTNSQGKPFSTKEEVSTFIDELYTLEENQLMSVPTPPTRDLTVPNNKPTTLTNKDGVTKSIGDEVFVSNKGVITSVGTIVSITPKTIKTSNGKTVYISSLVENVINVEPATPVEASPVIENPTEDDLTNALVQLYTTLPKGMQLLDVPPVIAKLVTLINQAFRVDEGGLEFRNDNTENILRSIQLINADPSFNVETIQDLIDNFEHNVDIIDVLTADQINNLKLVLDAINQKMYISNTLQSTETVSNDIDDLSFGITINQINLANSIIQTLNTVNANPTDAQIDAITVKVQLLEKLLQFKKTITGTNDSKFSIEEAYVYLYKAFQINDDSFDEEDFYNASKNLDSIFRVYKDTITSERNNLLNTIIKSFKDEYGTDDVKYNETTGKIHVGEEVDEDFDITDTHFANLNYKFKNVWFDVKTTKVDGKTITVTKDYNRAVINELIEKYKRSTIPMETGLSLSIKQDNVELDTNNLTVEQTEIANTVMDMRVGDNVQLSIDENGISFKIGDTKIGSMPDISTHINGLLISDGKVYTGFGELIKTLNSNPNEFLNSDTIKVLKQIKSYIGISKANNVSNKDISNANAKISSYVNNVLNSTDETHRLINELVSKFVNANNSDTTTALPITAEHVKSITNILFYKTPNQFLDSTTFTGKDIIKQIAVFDAIQEINHNKYLLYTKLLSDKNTTETKGTISHINKASILTENTLDKRKLNTNVLPIVDPNDTTRDAEIQFVSSKGTNLIDSRTGKDAKAKWGIDKSLKAGIHVVIKNTNGQYSTVPLRMNVLGSYTSNVNEDKGQEAIDYVRNTILDIVKRYSEYLVGREDTDINLTDVNKSIAELLHTSGLNQMIITGDTATANKDSNNTLFPYFKAMYIADNFGNKGGIIKFKTFHNEKGITTPMLHILRVNGNNVHYAKVNPNQFDNVDTVYTDDSGKTYTELDQHLYALSQLNPSNLTDDNHFDITSKTSMVQLMTELEDVKDLLRQAHTSSEGIVFGLGNDKSMATFTDPISGKTFNNPHDYLINSNSGYAQIATMKSEDTQDRVSNVDLFGNNTVNFNVDVEGLNTIKKGNIENPLNSISQNTAFNRIRTVIGVIDNTIAQNPNVTISHTGIENQGNVIARIHATTNAEGKLNLGYEYTNKFQMSIVNNPLINSPITNMLHERIHSLIISSIYNSNISNEDKRILVKQFNDSATSIINDFEKQLGLKDTKVFDAQMNKIFGLENSKVKSMEMLSNAISKIKQDIIDANLNLKDNELVTSASIAQELFTYMTEPIVMYAMSNVVPAGEYTRQSSNEGSFINRILNTIMNIYNAFLKLTGLGESINIDNFTLQVRDLLADVYTGFNGELDKIQTQEVVTPTTTEVTQEVTDEFDPLDLIMDIEDLQFGDSRINPIFVSNKNIDNLLRDDNNDLIC